MGQLPPGPGKKNAWRHIKEFTENRAEFLADMQRKYGDFCYFKIGPANIYLLNDPDLAKEVLLRHKDFPKTNSGEFLKPVLGEGLVVSGGDYHKRQRRLIQPAFNPKRIAAYGATITQYAVETAASWKDGQAIDLNAEMGRLALSIIAKTMFNTELPDMLERVQAALDVLLPIIDKMAKPGAKITMMIPTIGNLRFYRARRDLNNIIYDIIEQARKANEDRGDLLSMLLLAEDEEGDGKGMTDESIRDEALTIFLAGHETTALVLSFIWYLLARHPEVEARLHEELKSALGGRPATMEDMPNLPYLRQIICETMRLYPPAYLADRTPVKDWDTGRYVIPKGSYIFVSPYTMGRHPDFYPEPLKFDPERWTPGEAAKRPKWAYIPFGGGPRTCIGEHFAWAELMLIIATMAQHWTVRLESNDPLVLKPLITLRPRNNIQARLHSRKDAPVETTSA